MLCSARTRVGDGRMRPLGAARNSRPSDPILSTSTPGSPKTTTSCPRSRTAAPSSMALSWLPPIPSSLGKTKILIRGSPLAGFMDGVDHTVLLHRGHLVEQGQDEGVVGQALGHRQRRVVLVAVRRLAMGGHDPPTRRDIPVS